MNPIKIVIADQHYLIRQGLRSIFSDTSKYQIVFDTDDYIQIPLLINLYQADVVIIGLNIQGVNAIDVIRQTQKDYPSVKILVLDTNENTDDIVTILRLGVPGYILKQCDHKEIIDAVNAITQGKNFFCSNVLKINNFENTENCAGYETSVNLKDPVKLSSREVEILELISQGLTNNEIAEKIFLSVHTVATHRKNLMKKFNAKNNVDLVICAIKEHFIVP
ncbi:MAG: response regulator transcription factor [Flavobacteriales bacterium]|nr:response regulator transcription factor [Flavobacteriales bacterium]